MNRGHVAEAWRLLGNVFDSHVLKWFAGVCAAAWSFIAPTGATATLAQLICVFVAIDMATGVRVSIKKGKYLNSRLWNRIVDKAIAYGSLVVLAAVIPRHLSQYSWLALIGDGALGAACIGELISILENLAGLGVRWARPIAKAVKIRFGQFIEDEAQTITGHTVTGGEDGHR